MTKQSKSRCVLFLTAFLQVSLVAANVWQISNQRWIGAVIVGWLISFTWSFNVSRVAFGGWADRIIYSTGAAIGTLVGMLVPWLLYSWV